MKEVIQAIQKKPPHLRAIQPRCCGTCKHRIQHPDVIICKLHNDEDKFEFIAQNYLEFFYVCDDWKDIDS